MTLGTLPDWCENTWAELASLDKLTMLDIFNSKCHPLQRKAELKAMMAIATPYLSQNGTVVEIGNSAGGGLIFWPAYGAKRVGGYDPQGHDYLPHFQKIYPKVDWHLIHGSSLDTANVQKTKHWLNGKTIDVLFVDGDKNHFYDDFTNHIHLMSPNSVVFMHDITSTARNHWDRIEREDFNTCRLINTFESIHSMKHDHENYYEGWLKRWNGRGCGVGCVFMGELL